MENNPLVIERIIHAPAAAIWSALTDPDEMKEWYFDIPDFRAEVGFQFQFSAGEGQDKSYVHLCEVLEVVPETKLSYSWRYEGYGGNSILTFELTPVSTNVIVHGSASDSLNITLLVFKSTVISDLCKK